VGGKITPPTNTSPPTRRIGQMTRNMHRRGGPAWQPGFNGRPRPMLSWIRRGEPRVRPVDDHKDLGDPQNQGDHKDRPYGTTDDIIQAFKSMTTNAYIRGVKQSDWSPFPGRLWQRNYYERIVRNEAELAAIREYIAANPANWAEDEEYAP